MAAQGTIIYNDGRGAGKSYSVLDVSGIGQGPFVAMHTATDTAGNPITPAKDMTSASGLAPVTGSFSATGPSVAFSPIASRAFNVSLWGTFSATIQLERSFDGGTTWLPITAAGTQLYLWTAPASEVAEEYEYGVQYRVRCTFYTSGTVNYRISQ